MIAFILIGFVLWSFVIFFLDRPAIPAYRARDGYRIASMILFFFLLLTVAKAMIWHEELVLLIQACQ